MHDDTEIYRTVEQLGDLVFRAGAQMRRDVKPLLGGRLVDSVVWMAQIVRLAAIARAEAKVPLYNQLLDEIEAARFMLKRAFNNRFIAPRVYGESLPLTVSVAKQAMALRNHFASAPQ